MTTPSLDPLSTPGVRTGDILAGKYRVERVLGAGGMGIVVAAQHLQLGERVALKFLLPQALTHPDAVARFAREARAAVRIKSEHVARVTDVGQLENGSPYMVMEYLDGGDLSQWVEQRGAMTLDQAAEFILQACEAIAEAHSLGIVHRDLKPANLFCVRRADGLLSVKVLDFGISKITGMGTSGTKMDMTRTSAVMGSPFYMSPEQMHSARSVDHRTDVWALGVILYELVAGRVPFDAESVPELVLKIAGTQPVPLRAIRPNVPPAFEQLVFRCLEKDRERRFQNVGELALALREFAPPRAQGSVERVLRTVDAGRASQASLPPSLASGPQPAMANAASGTVSPWAHTASPPRSRAPIIAIVAVLGLALAAGAVFLVLKLASTSPQAPAAVAPTTSTSVVATASPPPSATAPVSALATAPAPSVAPLASSAPALTSSAPPATVSEHPTHPVAPWVPAAKPPAVPVVQHPPATKANCDPPYYRDAVGNRKYKPECL